jgi:hypothetical protein
MLFFFVPSIVSPHRQVYAFIGLAITILEI